MAKVLAKTTNPSDSIVATANDGVFPFGEWDKGVGMGTLGLGECALRWASLHQAAAEARIAALSAETAPLGATETVARYIVLYGRPATDRTVVAFIHLDGLNLSFKKVEKTPKHRQLLELLGIDGDALVLAIASGKFRQEVGSDKIALLQEAAANSPITSTWALPTKAAPKRA